MYKKILYTTIFALVITSLLGIQAYNSIITQDEKVAQAFGDLNSTLQRRGDLIPNLVATVEGYAKHETKAVQEVVRARASIGKIQLTSNDLANSELLSEFANKQAELQSALTKLLVVVENYPLLKASENFRDLQHQLEGTENRINFARQKFNAEVQVFNIYLRTFPKSLINNWFIGLERKAFFEPNPDSLANPTVIFN